MRPGGGIQVATDSATIGTGTPGDRKTDVGLHAVVAPVGAVNIGIGEVAGQVCGYKGLARDGPATDRRHPR